MFFQVRHLVFCALFFLGASLPPVFAAQAKSIKASGILEMKDGQQVRLAGLVIPEESLSTLSVLLSGKNVNFEQDSKNKDATKPKTGYLYVKTKELDFPFKAEARPRESTVMVNRLLITLGLARVDLEQEFKRREDFLKLETEARNKGRGIWSYE